MWRKSSDFLSNRQEIMQLARDKRMKVSGDAYEK